MTTENNILPNWIKKQASLGPNIEIDGMLNEENAYWYLLATCCPQIFECYAIILHPFGVDMELKRIIGQTDYDDFKSVKKNLKSTSWTNFFRLFNKEFDFRTSNSTQEEIRLEIVKDWPPYIGYPEEGDCDDEQLDFVRKKLLEKYGDQVVNYYYCLLKTHKWEEEKIYKGKLSELDKLRKDDELRDNPTSIFPDDKTWCIVTDYDLAFTYIGGSCEFIESITDNGELDIYKLTPMFKERS